MLEHSFNQAAGLQAFTQQRSARLMAMISHGDEQVELPLLWRLCTALSDFGYAVSVLDATVCETATNPGLEQMLNFTYWQDSFDSEVPQWNVIPSALGIQSLCTSSKSADHNLRLLGQVLPKDGIVFLYGNAEWLTTLLRNSNTSPILTLSSKKASLMSSYLALKRMVKNGALEPTVVNLTQDQHAVAASLGECARNFLGYDVKPFRIESPLDESTAGDEVQRLALRLMENALVLPAGYSAGAYSRGMIRTAPATVEARSH